MDEAIRKDAERYRYLRNNYLYRGRAKHKLEWYLPRVYTNTNLAEQLDNCIDAAIRRD